MDDKNTTIVKLSSQFAGLKSDKVLFDGFSQAVTQTIMKNFPNVQAVVIQIDGETTAQ